MRSLNIEPDHPLVLYNLGLVLLQDGQPQRAIEHFEYLSGVTGPENAPAHNLLGEASTELGDRDRAAEHFSAALRIQSDFFEA